MTFGVTYEGTLGKLSPLARSAVAREPFQAGQNAARRSPAEDRGGDVLLLITEQRQADDRAQCESALPGKYIRQRAPQ